MELKDKIKELENKEILGDIYVKEGMFPVLISVPHSINQFKQLEVKLSEPYTKAIALYLNEKLDVHVYINNLDIGIDPNWREKNYYTTNLVKYINDNNIKLVLDLHGAKYERKFDIDLGTLNDLTADNTTINTLIYYCNLYDINNVTTNDTFKGGGITRNVFTDTDAEIVQLEINAEYRMNINNLEKILYALEGYIRKYISK